MSVWATAAPHVVRRSAAAGTENRYGPAWAIGFACFAIAAVLWHPEGRRFPALAASAAAFAAIQLTVPAMRPRRDVLVCPLNFAVVICLFQLVVLPLSLVLGQVTLAILPMLPADHAINTALLLVSLGYLAFTVGFCLNLQSPARLPSLPSLLPSRHLVIGFFVCGMVAMLLMFRTPQSLLLYFSDATEVNLLQQASSSTLQGLLATLLRPFLQFAAILLWCGWADQRGAYAGWLERIVATGAVVVFVAAAGATSFLSRAAIVYPLIPLVAVYSRHVRRVSLPLICTAAAVLFIPLVAIGLYRTTGIQVTAFADLTVAFVAGINLLAYVQLYGQAPQFLAFLVEQTGYGERLYWGQTLVSSVMHPVPVIGKAFRETSGVGVYNTLIYGPHDAPDQVIPFVGEMFLNLHVAGVVIGFVLIGVAVAKLQELFDRSTSATDIYMIQFTAVWLLFLLHGSLAVISQIALYSFWPVYVYCLWRGGRIRHLRAAT